jgi:hypothetical protein
VTTLEVDTEGAVETEGVATDVISSVGFGEVIAPSGPMILLVCLGRGLDPGSAEEGPLVDGRVKNRARRWETTAANISSSA